jgi:type III secretory pathway component EscR
MGNFVAVPTFRRTYHVSKRSNTQTTTTTNDTQTTTAERENYHVYCNLSSDVESSLWITIKNRRKRTPQTNQITTTRYNILTFIPKNLFEQFRRLANIYFAILIGLNWVPIINAISKTVNISLFL